MFYNVENLVERLEFDRVTLEDHIWGEAEMRAKAIQINRAIRSGWDRQLPDFLALAEVQYGRPLELLTHLLGMHCIATAPLNDRKMATALLYRPDRSIRLEYTRSHTVYLPANAETPPQASREITLASFTLRHRFKNRPLTLAVNHWPAPRHAVDARQGALQALKETVSGCENTNLVCCGDFNTLPGEEGLFDRLSKELGCTEVVPTGKAPGTYYYAVKKKWNHLDRFFYRPAVDGPRLDVDQAACRIHSPSMLKKRGKPFRFVYPVKDKEPRGFSDHYPICLELLPG